MKVEFNEDQIDALKEFMNVSIGAATANLANLLGAFAMMHIPMMDICNTDELLPKIKSAVNLESIYYVTKQLFTGKFGGECMFIMSEVSAKNLGVHLYGSQIATKDDVNDAVIELTNILTSTIVSRLTQELNTEVQFFAPSSQMLKDDAILDNDDISHYSKIIIISTVIEFKDKKK